jgi:O-antigen/teichoic acid export membrane protein
VEFGKHIDKAFWAFADKALPAIYGIGFIFLVARVLPKEEYGGFVVIQTMFNLLSAVSAAFALQPMTKLAAETKQPASLLTASLIMQVVFIGIVALCVFPGRQFIASFLDPNAEARLASLLPYLPLLLLASLYRNLIVAFLQSRYEVYRIFWIDAVYFLGALMMIYVAHQFGVLKGASDVLSIAALMLAVSTLLALFLTRTTVSFTLTGWRESMASTWSFGKFMFAGGVTYSLFAQMDLFFVTTYVGPVAAATYYNAKIFTRMFDLLAGVLQMFLIPFSSKAFRRNDTEQLVAVAEKAICFSTIVLVPVFIMMTVFPQPILHFLYGGKYDAAAPAMMILSVLAFVVPWNAVAVGYLTGLGNVRRGLYASVGLIVLALPMYLLLTKLFGMIGASMALVSVFTLVSVWLVFQLKQVIPLRFWNVWKRVKDVNEFLRGSIFRKQSD